MTWSCGETAPVWKAIWLDTGPMEQPTLPTTLLHFLSCWPNMEALHRWPRCQGAGIGIRSRGGYRDPPINSRPTTKRL
jgi:hypothetical protein